MLSKHITKVFSSFRFVSSSATVPITPYKYHKLEGNELPSESTVTREEALKYIEQMQTVRRMETAAGNLYKEKAIKGFCHLYSGQEAVCVGIEGALREQDSIITSYRCHAFTFTRGASVHQVLAELTGRKTGCTEGKGGSMHMYGRNYYGGNGIVGAQVPLGAGIALAHKVKGDGGACVALYGDGAANQGQVFEAYNMAKLWDLPCIFICENNHYGMGTSVSRSSASVEYYTRGDYIPGIWVDGMQILAVKEAMKFALEYTTSGKGPILIECESYRYSGHSMSDPGTSYRTREEVQSVRKERDPITQFAAIAKEKDLVKEEEVKEIEKRTKALVDDAVKKAKSDPYPDLKEIYTDIYSDKPEPFKIRGCDNFSYVNG